MNTWLDCETLDATEQSLAAVLGIDRTILHARCLEFDLDNFYDRKWGPASELPSRVLEMEVVEQLYPAYYFHATRLIPVNTPFADGLLPLQDAVDGIWRCAPAPRGHTFAKAVERYLATKEAEGKRLIRDDRLNLARLKAALGPDTSLSSITADRVSAYTAQRLPPTPKERGEEGQRIGPATLNRGLASLRHLLRLAVAEWAWLDKAPVIRLAKEPQGRLRFLTADEIARLLRACDKPQSPYLHAIVTVAINAGLRQGEILGLTWERVDFSRGVILLERTKSGKRREVPMNSATDAARHALGDKAEGYVLRKSSGVAWGSIRTAFENAVKEAKLDDFTFHDLRHTFASHFMMRGGNLAELRDLLGQADVKMTTRYAHLSPSYLRAAVDKLEGLTPARAARISTRSVHEVESEPLSLASARNAGVAQRQSN